MADLIFTRESVQHEILCLALMRTLGPKKARRLLNEMAQVANERTEAVKIASAHLSPAANVARVEATKAAVEDFRRALSGYVSASFRD